MGVFMVNWDELDERDQCSSEADYSQVERICRHIAIPCHRVNFVKEYWNEVFRWMHATTYHLSSTPTSLFP